MKKLLLLMITILAGISANSQALDNIAPAVRELMLLQPGNRIETLIILNEQATTDAYIEEIRKSPTKRNDIRAMAIREMHEVASRTQPEFSNWLVEETSLNHRDIRTYWIINSIRARLNADEIRKVAMSPDVRYVAEPLWFEEGSVKKAQMTPVFDPGSHEEGLDVINAPALWKMGYTGYGTKVYVYDTGIDIDHPALRSNFAFHNDPLELSWRGKREDPYTCTNHGTHVAGTILGLDREMNDTIGVAFNARYIMSPQFLNCGEDRIDGIEGWQWALDPDGNPMTTDDIPDAANMSGGRQTNDTICGQEYFNNLFQGLQIADIGACFSAGNSGPGDATTGSPAVHNYDLVHAFAVGNLSLSNFDINLSSSRGPSHCFNTDSSLFIKPEVSAPGTDVRSSIVGGGYDENTGTSMAAPHVTGAFLLLREAYPYLNEAEILLSLYLTAVDYGEPGEDNVFGMGVIDVLAAFEYLQDKGFDPVPPLPREKDLVAIDLGLDERSYCTSIPALQVKFENAGLDTIYSVQLDFSETNGLIAPFSKQWSGVLAHDEIGQLEFELPEELQVFGTYELLMEISLPDSEDEVRLLDNRFKKRFRVYDAPDFRIQQKDPSNPEVCYGARTWLSSSHIPENDQRIVWYANKPSGNPLGEGSRFLAPETFDPEVYFAVLETLHSVGATMDQSALEFGEDNLGGLIFDAARPFTLRSVKVNSGDAGGGRMIQLFDEEGESVISKLAIVPAGEQEIQLNWKIEEGNGYRLEITTGKPFAHVTSDTGFPFEVENLVTIRSGIYDGVVNENTYYYFFDWEVVTDHPCGPASIELTTSEADTLPPVGIIASTDTVFLSDGGSLMLEAEGEGFSIFDWELSDGQLLTGQSVVATFSQPGSVFVYLNGTTDEGCSTGAVKEVVVIDDLQTSIAEAKDNLPSIKIFPNPASGALYVQFDEPGTFFSGDTELEMYNLLGQKVADRRVNPFDRVVKLDVSNIPTGQYFLQVAGQVKMVMVQ